LICHVTVQTENIQESIDFYQWLLDLPVVSRHEIPGGELAFLGAAETKLEFICERNYKKQDKIEGITVGFKVDNLDKKIEMMKNRNIGVSAIIMPSSNVRFCFFTDLNGVSIQLFEEK
jgi:lactoylglutathione lyase